MWTLFQCLTVIWFIMSILTFPASVAYLSLWEWEYKDEPLWKPILAIVGSIHLIVFMGWLMSWACGML